MTDHERQRLILLGMRYGFSITREGFNDGCCYDHLYEGFSDEPAQELPKCAQADAIKKAAELAKSSHGD